MPEGWHPFLGQDYLDGLEDAILFAHENGERHHWKETGMTIDTSPEFAEKKCTTCGAINWGGKEDSICFGNKFAESGRTAAHNRRAFRHLEEHSVHAVRSPDA